MRELWLAICIKFSLLFKPSFIACRIFPRNQTQKNLILNVAHDLRDLIFDFVKCLHCNQVWNSLNGTQTKQRETTKSARFMAKWKEISADLRPSLTKILQFLACSHQPQAFHRVIERNFRAFYKRFFVIDALMSCPKNALYFLFRRNGSFAMVRRYHDVRKNTGS